jgi:hypothetical protein
MKAIAEDLGVIRFFLRHVINYIRLAAILETTTVLLRGGLKVLNVSLTLVGIEREVLVHVLIV